VVQKKAFYPRSARCPRFVSSNHFLITTCNTKLEWIMVAEVWPQFHKSTIVFFSLRRVVVSSYFQAENKKADSRYVNGDTSQLRNFAVERSSTKDCTHHPPPQIWKQIQKFMRARVYVRECKAHTMLHFLQFYL
jgi:hypothetical protein